MKKLLAICVAGLITLFTSQCYAQDVKIGIVNMDKVLQKSQMMIGLNQDLAKKFQARQAKLIDAQKQLQDENNRLTLGAGTMSTDERTTLQNKIIADKADVEILGAGLQRDVAIAKDEALRQFMTKLNLVINKIATDEHYDLIQQSSGFAFVNNKLDITDKIIQEMS